MQSPPLTNSSSLATSISMLMTLSITIFYLLASCNLTQHVNIPTRRHCHTLDLAITLASTSLNPIITSSFIVTSYHYPVLTNINVHPNPPPPPTTVTHRCINAIDKPIFIIDLNSNPIITKMLDIYFSIHCLIITLLSSLKPIKHRSHSLDYH